MATNIRKVIGVAFTAEGAEALNKEFQKLGQSGADAAKKITDSFNKVSFGTAFARQLAALRVQFGAVLQAGSRFVQSMGTARLAVGTFVAAVGGAVRNIALLKGALVGVAGSALFLASKFGQNAERIRDQAAALGISTDAYQRLNAAARDANIEQAQFDRVMTKFTVGVEEAGDEADKASGKTDKLAKSFEQVSVRGADGAAKLITVRRGAVDAKDAVAGFASVTKKGADGLREYAKSIVNAGSTQQQLALIVKEYGSRGAAQMLTFLRNVELQFDDVKRAAAGLIPVLTEAEIAIGADLDSAFFNLGENLNLIRDRLTAVFGPVLIEVLKQFTFLIQDNEEAMVKWATEIKNGLIQVMLDVLALIRGDEAAVENTWLIDLKDAALAVGTAFVFVKNLVVEAAKGIYAAAELVAEGINSIFGTDFTTGGLIAIAVILKLSGALTVLGAAFGVALSFVQLFRHGLALIGTVLTVLGGPLRLLAAGLGYIGAAIGVLLGVPAAVGVAIALAIAAAAALIYIYFDEIVAAAQFAWDRVSAAAEEAASSIIKSFGRIGEIGFDVLTGDFSKAADKIKDDGLTAFEELKAGIATDIDNINALLALVGIDGAAIWESISTNATKAFDATVSFVERSKTRIVGALEQVRSFGVGLWEQIAPRAREAFDAITSSATEAGGLVKAGLTLDLSQVWTAISNGAAQAFDRVVATAKTLPERLTPYWTAITTGAGVIFEGITSAAAFAWDGVVAIVQGAAAKIAEGVSAVALAALEAWSGASLSIAQSAEAIVAAISRATEIAGDVEGAQALAATLVQPFIDAALQIELVWIEMSAIVTAQTEALVAAVAVILGAIATAPGLASLSGALSSPFVAAAVTIRTTWQDVMRAVVASTQDMVSSVESLISRLRSTLASLRASIAAARAEASSSGDGRAAGGFISGPGSGTSDSIPAWLSNGEFVLKARAVKHWGLGALYALNNLRTPDFGKAFNMGGLVANFEPRFAGGGFVRPQPTSTLRPTTLVIGDKSYPGFMAPQDTLAELEKAAVVSRLAKGGRDPKWR